MNREELGNCMRNYRSLYRNMKKDYDMGSPEKKIKIQLARRSVFNMELDVIEKMHTSRKLNELEKEIIGYQQNFLQEKVWLCEQEIYFLYDNNPINKRVCKKIEDAYVPKWPYISGIPSFETLINLSKYNSGDKILSLIMFRRILNLEFNVIRKEVHKLLKSQKGDEYQKSFLSYRLYIIEFILRQAKIMICRIYYNQVADNFQCCGKIFKAI